MTTEPTSTTPTCYRHADRETWVSCGRCGKPLCPDCVMHGPVGIRCRECLLPQGKGSGLIDAAQLRKATRITVLLAVAGVLVHLVACVICGYGGAVISPNVLIAALTGGLVGWVVWRHSNRTYNTATLRLAVIAGIAIPLVATLIIVLVFTALHGSALLTALFFGRAAFAVATSAFFAWLLASNTV